MPCLTSLLQSHKTHVPGFQEALLADTESWACPAFFCSLGWTQLEDFISAVPFAESQPKSWCPVLFGLLECECL